MKHIVGPRRCGKSTKLAEYMLSLKENVIYLSPILKHWDFVMVPIMHKLLKSKKIQYKYSDLEKSFFIQNNTIIKALNTESPFLNSFRKTKKVFDEVGWYLERKFGSIDCFSSTGPNYKLDKSGLKELGALIKKQDPELAKLDEFKATWELNGKNQKKKQIRSRVSKRSNKKIRK